jgi:hypothetical protein
MFKSKTGGGMRGLPTYGRTGTLGRGLRIAPSRQSEMQLTNRVADGGVDGRSRPTGLAHRGPQQSFDARVQRATDFLTWGREARTTLETKELRGGK